MIFVFSFFASIKKNLFFVWGKSGIFKYISDKPHIFCSQKFHQVFTGRISITQYRCSLRIGIILKPAYKKKFISRFEPVWTTDSIIKYRQPMTIATISIDYIYPAIYVGNLNINNFLSVRREPRAMLYSPIVGKLNQTVLFYYVKPKFIISIKNQRLSTLGPINHISYSLTHQFKFCPI